MTESRDDRIEDIAQHAARLTGQERSAFLAQSCGDDAELRAQVEAVTLEIEQDAADPSFWRAPNREQQSDDAPKAATLPAGFRIGDFEILGELGRGGMRATVYLANQLSLQREVALKVLFEGGDASQRDVERFHRSAIAAAKLHHAGIVPVHAHGTESKAHYLAMEYVAGHDLAREIELQGQWARRATPGRPELFLPPRDSREFVPAALRLCRDVAHALQHAHEQRIVHRDVKPQNLMLDRAGQVHVVDFGLARDSGGEQQPPRLTKSGVILGTVAYMSPEQARAARHVVDHRTDIYSLGAVLYELLSGTQPFRGESEVEILSAIVAREPRPLRSLAPDVPSDVAAVCSLAMAKVANERYRSAGDFADDLDCVLALRHPKHARAPTLRQHTGAWLRRNRRALFTAAGILIGMVLSAWWVGHAADASSRQRSVVTLLRVRDSAHLETLPFDALYDAKVAVADLRAHTNTSRVQQQLAGEVEQRLEAYYRNALVTAEGDLNVGLGGRHDSHPGAVRVDHIVRGVNRLRDAARLFPERQTDNLSSLALLPTLSVRVRDEAGQVLSGRIVCRYLDQVTGVPGPPTELTRFPCDQHPVPPGFVRLTAIIDGHGAREFTRTLWHPASEVVIDYVVRPDQVSLAGMVRIAAAAPRTSDTKSPYGGQPVEAFWIDEAEVTLGDFRRFLRATQRQDPFATLGNPPTRFDDLPAVFVSWENAVAYAEWVGKRLPSAAEWDWAARGINARLFPYTDARDGVDYLGNSSLALPPEVSTDRLAVFLSSARAVRAHPEARTAEGLFEMLGNVMEWTESMAAQEIAGTWRPLPDMRWQKGAFWQAKQHGATLRADGVDGTTDDFANHLRGLRCARSITP